MSWPPVRAVVVRSWQSSIRQLGSRPGVGTGRSVQSWTRRTLSDQPVVARPRRDRPAPRPYARRAAAGRAGDLRLAVEHDAASARSGSSRPPRAGRQVDPHAARDRPAGRRRRRRRVLIGPAGTPTASSAASRSSRVKPVVRSAMQRATSASRLRDAQRVGGVVGVARPAPARRARAQSLRELPVIADGDDDVAVRDGKDLVGHDVGMGVADARRGALAGDEVVHRLVGEHGDLRVEQRHVEMRALAGRVALAQRRQDADDGIDAGEDVGDRRRRPSAARRPARR